MKLADNDQLHDYFGQVGFKAVLLGVAPALSALPFDGQP
jgi:hypothetical protein